MSTNPLHTVDVGREGDAVLDVQARLQALGYPIASDERGIYGPQTESAVQAFQVSRGLSVDGTVGSVTWRELWEAGQRLGSRMLYVRFPPMRGDDVRDLQLRLNALGFDAGTEDGIYSQATERGVREFQRNAGLPADGLVARNTVEALDALRRQIRPGSKAELRERLARERGGLDGRFIFLDPAHGGSDVGHVTSAGLPESWVVYRIAELASQHLTELGARPRLSRHLHQAPEPHDRTVEANSAQADIAVSLHVACRPEPSPSVAFYARPGSQSGSGRALAGSIADRLHLRLGQPVTVLGRNVPFLRETAMPAVLIDLGCPGTERLLGEDPFLADLAGAVADGVRGYFEHV